MAERELAAALFDACPSALLAFNEDGVLTEYNSRWMHLAQSASLDETGVGFDTLVQELGIAPLQAGESERVQEVTRNRRTLVVRQRILPLEKARYTVLTIEDISGVRERMRSFVRNTGDALWKIRSRTTGVQNALNLLVEYSSDSLGTENVALLRESLFETWQLSRYCDNLRDLSGLDAGMLDIAMEPCELKSAVDAAIGNVMVYVGYQGKRCNLEVSIPEGLLVMADWSRLVHVIDAVALNSAVYSGEEVSIGVAARDEGGHVALTVSDDGLGIDEEDLAMLFTPGFRGRNASGVAYNGMGSELHLSRQLLTRMNGAIEVHSKKGVGATTEITLEREGA